MEKISFKIVKRLSVVLLALLILSCMSKPAEELADNYPTTHHLNAELGVALTLPQSWKRLPASTLPPYAAGWQGPSRKKDGSTTPRLIITVSSPTRWPGGFDAMRSAYLADHPAFTLSSEQKIELTAGTAWEISGQDNRLAYRVFFLTTASRAFVLEFSVPPLELQTYEALFLKTAQSVETLP